MENNENNAVYPNGEEMPIGNMPEEGMQTEEQPVGGAEPTAEEIGGGPRDKVYEPREGAQKKSADLDRDDPRHRDSVARDRQLRYAAPDRETPPGF